MLLGLLIIRLNKTDGAFIFGIQSTLLHLVSMIIVVAWSFTSVYKQLLL
ncbi:unnamed protein product [Amoebophrya sp. A25]|nr:unnamed protein product [Amoebophrya sp. A25]|eukprot:GSA25T00019916001.1